MYSMLLYRGMHSTLQSSVRHQIAEITQHIFHSLEWGQFTQVTYPGESKWTVDGGYDWGIDSDKEVSVTALAGGGCEVTGIELVYERIHMLETQEEHPHGEGHCSVGNNISGLKQVLQVLEEALKCNDAHQLWLASF
jgi:hypothetical protein